MTRSGSWPAATMASRSPIGMPSMRSSVSTRCGGAVPVDRRRAIAGIVGEVLAQLLGGGGLHAQVHLDPHDVGEGAHRIDRLQAAVARLGALDQLGHPVEEVEVALEGQLDGRPQHLDRDLAAVGGDGEMDLGDRGGGDRRVVEAGEQRVDRLAELGLDGAPRLGAGEGRQVVLQLRQVGGDLFAQKIGAGRQRLAELDEGRAHLLQRRRQPLARPARDRGRRANSRAQTTSAGAMPRISSGNSASCRARLSAMRSRRQDVARMARAACLRCRQPECRRHDAQRHVAPGDVGEAHLAHAPGELALRREAADALVQIAVGLGVLATMRPKNGSARLGVGVVDAADRRRRHLAELQAVEAAARLQHAVRFARAPCRCR